MSEPSAAERHFARTVTFAERRATALPALPPRMVSLGPAETRLSAAGRDGTPTIIEGELFVEEGRRDGRMYLRTPGGAIYDMSINHVGEGEKVTPLGSIRKRHQDSPHFPAAPAEEPPRQVGRIRTAMQARNAEYDPQASIEERLARLEGSWPTS